MPGYKKLVSFKFEVGDEPFAIVGFDSTYFEVEEMRKNGQEDCHMAGVAVIEAGKWKWQEENISEYDGQELADAVLAYVQENGLPKDD